MKKDKGGMKKSEKFEEDIVQNFIAEIGFSHSEII